MVFLTALMWDLRLDSYLVDLTDFHWDSYLAYHLVMPMAYQKDFQMVQLKVDLKGLN